MIYPSLDFLRQQLNEFLHSIDNLNIVDPTIKTVVLGDIARTESSSSGGMDGEDINSSVVLTLIRIEEETKLSNQRHFTSTEGGIQYHNKPLHLNLYLMASANFTPYSTALKYLDQIIQFFVSNKVFLQSTHPALPDMVPQLFVDLYDPGFEQLSYVWGPLGGKAFPSVLYRVRLVAYRDSPNTIGQPIDAIGLNENAL